MYYMDLRPMFNKNLIPDDHEPLIPIGHVSFLQRPAGEILGLNKQHWKNEQYKTTLLYL